MELAEQFIRDNQIAAEFLLYFLFFASLVRASLYRHFHQHTGALSVGIGAALAAALLLARHRLGYSLEALGEPAVVLIILAISVVAYRFLTWSDAPTPVALLAALGLAAIALDAALPDWQVTRQAWFGPALIVLSLVSAAGLVSTSTDGPLTPIHRPLVRAGLLPQGHALRKEAQALKKNQAKKIRREEQRAQHQLQKAANKIRTKHQTTKRPQGNAPPASTQNATPPRARNNTEKEKKRILKRIESAEREANKALSQLVQLQKIDRAIEQFDLTQLSRISKANLAQFTPEQRQELKENLKEERQRLGLEQHLDRLTHATEHTIFTLRSHLENTTTALRQNNFPGAQGWLQKANETLQYARHTSKQIEQLRNQLIRSLQHQARATR